MQLADIDFHLPEQQIAQRPLDKREASRMLIVDRKASEFRDARFAELPDYLGEGDVLVLNNTRVIPARLFGHTETGAAVEVFLISDEGDNCWECLARPGRRLRAGKAVTFGGQLSSTVLDKLPDGKVLMRFEADDDLNAVIERIGRTPLPPYIKRDAAALDDDRERYQTVFAKSRGAIAAPTAGLHFTPQILETIKNKGVEILEITLHVGYGTFEAIRVDDLALHKVLPERYLIDKIAADRLNKAMAGGHRIVAVGTTTTRSLESNFREFGRFSRGDHLADLTVTPGYQFRVVGGLLTNFHLPKSSLLVLTSVFGGHQLIMESYGHAVAAGYRFYSYGDCMLIV